MSGIGKHSVKVLSVASGGIGKTLVVDFSAASEIIPDLEYTPKNPEWDNYWRSIGYDPAKDSVMFEQPEEPDYTDFTPSEEIEALFDTTVLELPVPSPFDIIVNESAADLEQLGEKTQELCTKTDVLIKKVGLSISDIVSGGRRSLNAANFFKTQTEGRHWYKKTLKVQKK
jgi:hypothetical protein